MLDEGSQTDAVLRGERRSLRGSSEDGIQPGFVEECFCGVERFEARD